MSRELMIYEELRKMRNASLEERPALRLPNPNQLPYWRRDEPEEAEEESVRGVVIIDMNDYTEVDV